MNLEIKDNKNRTPLWLSLTVPDDKIDPDDEDSVAARLSQAGASPDSIDSSSGEEYHFLLKQEIFISLHVPSPLHTGTFWIKRCTRKIVCNLDKIAQIISWKINRFF